MTGAESMLRALAGAGVDVCFTNPGTTEMPFVSALGSVPEIRPVLGLFEGVCTGAADAYGRVRGRPAMCLLHLGPGLGNGIANLHNARRAGTPLLCVVGEHATWHLGADPPLASDIAALARPVSGWVRTSESAATLADDAVEALAAASEGQVATLIVPADCQREEIGSPASTAGVPPSARTHASDDAVNAAAAALGSGGGAILLGGSALGEPGLRAAGRIAGASGARLISETFPTVMERGGDLPATQRLPYFPGEATASLEGAPCLVLAGARAPVAFFGYPGTPSALAPPDVEVHGLAAPDEDAVEALERLARRLGAESASGGGPGAPAGLADGDAPLDPASAGATVAALQPEGAIVVEEAITAADPYFEASVASARHTYLAVTGGAIGQGLPAATGAAIARPDRPVLCLEADGSGLYTPQSLWTQAHEDLDVTTVVYANRDYRILQAELGDADTEGTTAHGLTELTDPAPDWVSLARAFGVPGQQATTTGELAAALERALGEPGPHLIEMVV